MYNGFKHSMEVIRNWRLWGWCIHFYHSVVVAFRDKKSTCDCTGEDCYCRKREGGSLRKARRLFKQSDQSERHGDTITETSRDSISEKQERIIKQNAEIATLHNNVLSYITNQYKSGEVDSMPDTKDMVFEISENVNSRLLSTDNVRTIYIVNFEEGASIPVHNHTQFQQVVILDGSVQIRFPEQQNVVTLNRGDSFYIDEYSDHTTTSELGATLLSIFEPPIISYQ